jgi:hypothetical protein
MTSDGAINLCEFINLYDELFNERSKQDRLSNEKFFSFFDFYANPYVIIVYKRNENKDFIRFSLTLNKKTKCIEFLNFEKFWTNTVKPVSFKKFSSFALETN